MKKLILQWAFLLPALTLIALLFSTQAKAAPCPSQLDRMRIDPELQWPGDIRLGEIYIAPEMREVVLKLKRGDNCPMNALCLENGKDVEIRLPLKDRFTDPNGQITTTAQLQNPDGTFESLVVIDNSKSESSEPSMVHYERQTSTSAQTFEANLKGPSQN